MENTHKILIVDDDYSNLELLSAYLDGEGYTADTASDGVKGLHLAQSNEYALVLLDVMMPKMDGHQMIKALRKENDVPIIFITARDSQQDINRGFLLGCDDYLIKPFDLTELKLRINAMIKRSTRKDVQRRKESLNKMVYKDIEIDVLSHQVKKDGKTIDFTSKEFEILKLLISNQGRVYSAKMIYELIWDDVFLSGDRAVLTHIGNVREKLGDNIKRSVYIKTIWGVGYKIEKENI